MKFTHPLIDQADPILIDNITQIFSALSIDEIRRINSFEFTCIIMAHLYRAFDRELFADETDPLEILRTRKGMCGGMVLAAQSLYAALGYKSHIAYTIGGTVAHSMLEIDTIEGSALLDFYNGIAFIDKKTRLPLSLEAVIDSAQANENICLYAKKDCLKFFDLRFDDVLLDHEDHDRSTFSWPDNFLNLDGHGLSGSGEVDFNIIELKPNQTLGNENWKVGLEGEATPYMRLAHLKHADGSAHSWAYMNGQTGIGYHIQHTYYCQDLVPGNSYNLKIGLINAFSLNKPKLKWTLRALSSKENYKKINILPLDQDYKVSYDPVYVNFDFIAKGTTEIILSYLEGEVLLASIALYENRDI
jgi:hypothetical protein